MARQGIAFDATQKSAPLLRQQSGDTRAPDQIARQYRIEWRQRDGPIRNTLDRGPTLAVATASPPSQAVNSGRALSFAPSATAFAMSVLGTIAVGAWISRTASASGADCRIFSVC